MYSIRDLLDLAQSERADGLKLRAGAPPALVVRGESQTVEGYELTETDAEELLRTIGGTRQMRDLWAHGDVNFIYKLRDKTPFLIHAWVENESIRIEIT